MKSVTAFHKLICKPKFSHCCVFFFSPFLLTKVGSQDTATFISAIKSLVLFQGILWDRSSRGIHQEQQQHSPVASDFFTPGTRSSIFLEHLARWDLDNCYHSVQPVAPRIQFALCAHASPPQSLWLLHQGAAWPIKIWKVHFPLIRW